LPFELRAALKAAAEGKVPAKKPRAKNAPAKKAKKK
jgi:hypothetical protein